MPTASVIIDKIGSWTEALKQRYWGTVARSLRFLGTFRVALVFHLPLSNGIQCPCRNTVSPERSSSVFFPDMRRLTLMHARASAPCPALPTPRSHSRLPSSAPSPLAESNWMHVSDWIQHKLESIGGSAKDSVSKSTDW